MKRSTLLYFLVALTLSSTFNTAAESAGPDLDELTATADATVHDKASIPPCTAYNELNSTIRDGLHLSVLESGGRESAAVELLYRAQAKHQNSREVKRPPGIPERPELDFLFTLLEEKVNPPHPSNRE